MEKTKDFKNLCKKHSPPSKIFKDTLFAAAIGGAICFLGEWLAYFYSYLGAEEKNSYLLVTLTLIFLASVATSFGFFDRIATLAGAGTLVPVTGFSNAVTSAAIDTRSEGLCTGVGTKIFTVAGPVILFSSICGVLYGIVYFLYTFFIK